MKDSEACSSSEGKKEERPQKPAFRPAKDDTKLLLQDPIRRSDPIDTEEPLLRPPPFHLSPPKSNN